ncbi:MAG TPA: hypothetical protein VGR21_13820 [Cryptosporangiaceae bacterium]|nr:hypothetical protein [Cryptosporangiaceae bacterium]
MTSHEHEEEDNTPELRQMTTGQPGGGRSTRGPALDPAAEPQVPVPPYEGRTGDHDAESSLGGAGGPLTAGGGTSGATGTPAPGTDEAESQ